MQTELLRMEKITKRFGDFYANKKVDLVVNRGEVVTLLGENGAGKSTLMNILIGLYRPTEGRIFFRGKEVRIHSPKEAVEIGIGMVHQHFMLVEAMSVFDNIILGDRKSKSFFIDREARRKEILELSWKYGLGIDLEASISEVSVGTQQRVEILKALYHGAQLLILDEPTAALTDMEVEGLFRIIEKLVEEGKSVIFISHKMREVLRVSHRIVVLRQGEAVAGVSRNEADAETLAQLMIGKEIEEKRYLKKTVCTEPLLCVQDVSYHPERKHGGLNRISLSLCPGEILGIAGVDGNGQTQLAQLVTGMLTPTAGEVFISGKQIKVFEPSKFMDMGVANVPEDRNNQGLVGEMSITENLLLKDTDKPNFSYGKGLLLKKTQMKKRAGKMVEQYDVRCAGMELEVRSLSGGNQQKIILAREIESSPKLLVVAHPTRGLDIGATSFIHRKMIEARESGVGILLISADFDEILKLSDRILVMFEGEFTGEFDGGNPPIEQISMAMTGNRQEA